MQNHLIENCYKILLPLPVYILRVCIFCIYACKKKRNTRKNSRKKNAYFTFRKPNLGEVVVDMLIFAVVSLSPTQVMVFCYIVVKCLKIKLKLLVCKLKSVLCRFAWLFFESGFEKCIVVLTFCKTFSRIPVVFLWYG